MTWCSLNYSCSGRVTSQARDCINHRGRALCGVGCRIVLSKRNGSFLPGGQATLQSMLQCRFLPSPRQQRPTSGTCIFPAACCTVASIQQDSKKSRLPSPRLLSSKVILMASHVDELLRRGKELWHMFQKSCCATQKQKEENSVPSNTSIERNGQWTF